MHEAIIAKILRQYGVFKKTEVEFLFSELQGLIGAKSCQTFSKILREVCKETKSTVFYNKGTGVYRFVYTGKAPGPHDFFRIDSNKT